MFYPRFDPLPRCFSLVLARSRCFSLLPARCFSLVLVASRSFSLLLARCFSLVLVASRSFSLLLARCFQISDSGSPRVGGVPGLSPIDDSLPCQYLTPALILIQCVIGLMFGTELATVVQVITGCIH